MELNKKLAELDERSRDAGQAIDTVAKSLAARESSFVSGMNGRLAEWDQRVSLELKRVDDVAKSAASLEVRTKGLGAQIEALLGSFKAALDVAHELRSGTATGELPLIGKVYSKNQRLCLFATSGNRFVWRVRVIIFFTRAVPRRVVSATAARSRDQGPLRRGSGRALRLRFYALFTKAPEDWHSARAGPRGAPAVWRELTPCKDALVECSHDRMCRVAVLRLPAAGW